MPKQLKTSHDQQPTYGQTQQRWVPKAKEGKSTIEQKREVPQHSNKLTKAVKKATVLEKGKWIPKVAITPVISHEEQLPSTSSHATTESSTYTAATQRQTQPLSGKNPLDAVKQLVFILRTFNSKQVGGSIWHPRLQVKDPCE